MMGDLVHDFALLGWLGFWSSFWSYFKWGDGESMDLNIKWINNLVWVEVGE